MARKYCFTSTKVQILTRLRRSLEAALANGGLEPALLTENGAKILYARSGYYAINTEAVMF
jgi:hypothetical protein